MNLNDKLIKSLKPTSKTYRMADGRGLYLQVEPNGSKLWRWNYKFSSNANNALKRSDAGLIDIS